MTVRRIQHRWLSTALAAILFALPVIPAFATDGDLPPSDPPVATITAAVTFAGTSLQGLTAEQAGAAIAAAMPSRAFDPIPVDAAGRIFVMDAGSALTADIAGLVADAMVASETVDLAPRWAVDSMAVGTFVAGIAADVDRNAVDAKRVVSRRRLKLTASSPGARLDRAAAIVSLTAALASEASGSAVSTVTVPVSVVAPRVTASNIGKTIIVSLGEFRVFLYNGARYEKIYRCAIGMRAYPTPRGTFKVVAKSAAPTWRNPYSAWSRKMPAYIRPGYYNPLGLRALYINAPGIRIHGTSKTWSIGRAASHGCIRLTNRNIVDIYPRVKVGTPVYIVK